MTDPQTPLGDTLTRLYATIETRRTADPETSYTAALLAGGPEKCARKFGEEALEAVIAGVGQNRGDLTLEAADVLYHLLALMAALGVTPEDVAAALAAREGISGHAEKAARKDG